MKKAILTIAAIAAFGASAFAQTPIARFGIDSPLPVSFIPADMMANHQPGFATLTINQDDPQNSQISILNNQFQAIGNPIALPMTMTPSNYREQYFDEETNTWVDRYNEQENNVLVPSVMPYVEFSNSGINTLSVIALSQTLFNNDEDFEYIMPVTRDGGADTDTWYGGDYEEVWVEGHWEYDYWGDEVDSFWVDGYYDYQYVEHRYRRIRSHVEGVGFNVVKPGGAVVRTINLPEGYVAAGGDDFPMFFIGLAKLMDVYYLVVPAMHVSTYVEDDYTYTDEEVEVLVYEVNPGTQSINLVETEIPISVFPSFVNRGENITVDLGSNSQAREIRVVNQLGQTVKTVNVRPGQSEVKINTGDLNSGVNFINAFNSKASSSYKIVVR